MAIKWTAMQRIAVDQVLRTHPVDSGRCRMAAFSLLPIARERDETARTSYLVPTEGRYVVPRTRTERPWHYHATTEVELHCVDALTGTDGTERSSYLAAHWKYPEALTWTDADPEGNGE